MEAIPEIIVRIVMNQKNTRTRCGSPHHKLIHHDSSLTEGMLWFLLQVLVNLADVELQEVLRLITLMLISL